MNRQSQSRDIAQCSTRKWSYHCHDISAADLRIVSLCSLNDYARNTRTRRGNAS